ncbi:Pyrroline-5-carboxylate reductase 1, mitochondrial [Phytophthora pseudosyringae]|uniref:Pyrroline-5-carboxylate reductase 1, mitochondrial n=1 Tax=Phytophthora pseudosyringae TaxID=221518 RepID=A0A8T1VJR7_9STRA|nr:Pyrroline-5-carboxylate reductase 1, mitochondrial [Phytophthora pseudosyringae]
MANTSPIGSTLALSNPPPSVSAGTGSSSKELNKPFKIRAELLTPTRLAPKAQLLLHTRSLSIQVLAHEVFLLVLACSKCFAAANKQPPRIGILGGGSVGTAVVMTLLANGYRAERMALSTRQPDRIPRCEALKAPSALPMFQLVPRYYDNARLARESDVLVLCMPPAQLKSVAIQVRHALAANADAPSLVISALCGVTHQSLSKACGSQAVMRVQPDVAKIARLWHDQQHQNDKEDDSTGTLSSRTQTPAGMPVSFADYQQNAGERDRQPLPLRLAAEAIAPHRDDVRNLLQAFAMFCRRAWNPDVRVDALDQVLFGGKSEIVIATIGQVSAGDSGGQQQEERVRAKTPLEVPTWPEEWEQDLNELQEQLAANALK